MEICINDRSKSSNWTFLLNFQAKTILPGVCQGCLGVCACCDASLLEVIRINDHCRRRCRVENMLQRNHEGGNITETILNIE